MAVTPKKLKKGNVALVTAVITEQAGLDISSATYEVAHVLDSQKADDEDTYTWETPHAESGSVTPAVYLVSKLVDTDTMDAAKYRVFVRTTDNPEILLTDCGTYTITP